MKVFRGIDDFPKLDGPIVTSGTFDGVHLGHQKILNKIKDIAKSHGGETVLVTFWPHPRITLGHEVKLLSTLEEKIQLLEAIKIDYLLILPFTSAFAQLDPEEYIHKVYIEGINTKKLIVGYDHHFGKDRKGNLSYLRSGNYPFDVEEISRFDIDHVGISSTKIREALKEGNVSLAAQYLGRYYDLQGKVVGGDQLGRTIGFPTANIEIEDHYKLIPKDAIYAVWVSIGQERYKGMLYIGKRPTLKNSLRKIEVHLFDFDQDIYGQNVRISFIKKVREDQKFESMEALRDMLEKDKEQSLKILSD